MTEDYSRGSKRRLSDVDENERLTSRQMVLNTSICKLQKDHGRKEPSLLRQVLIANTLHKIEEEMEEEIQLNSYRTDDFYPSFAKSIEAEVNDWNKREIQIVTNDSVQKDPAQLRASFADIGTDILPARKTQCKLEDFVESLEDDKSDIEPNKFGVIGDHRKNTHQGNKIKRDFEYTTLEVPDLFSWDVSAAGQLQFPFLTSPVSVDSDSEFFPDIDVTLYDFDFLTLSSQQQLYVCDEWKPISDVSLLKSPISCGSEADRRRGDSFFDDLDQIMQVLVGI